jgi:GMP synthase (glutamine-hydrolysing)
VEGGHAAEFGRAEVTVHKPSALYEGVWEGRPALSRLDEPWRPRHPLPPGFEVVATSENAPFAVAVDEARRIYTTMFHPEVVHTPAWRGAAPQFRKVDLRLHWGMDHGLPGGDPSPHPRAGGFGQGDLRPLRRRRFLGGGGADP